MQPSAPPCLAGWLLTVAFTSPIRASEPFMVADINATGTGSHPESFVELDGLVYFTAEDTLHGRELWVSDGTDAGTHRVTDLWPGPGDSVSSHLVVFDGRLFFAATANGQPTRLWTSSGNEVDTVPLGTSAETGTAIDFLTIAANRLFYVATVSGSRLLFESDGTADGTAPLALALSSRSLAPTDAATVGSGPVLFFSAEGEVLGRVLWVTDGTPGGTTPLPPVVGPFDLATLPGRRVIAAARDGQTWKLWVSDGTAAGTETLFELSSPPIPFIHLLAAAGDRLFFSVSRGVLGDLWITDGTEAGTHQVAPLLAEELEEAPVIPSFAVLGDRLFFQAFAQDTGHELWISDGTAAGTRLFADIAPGYDESRPTHLTAAREQIFFSATTPEHGQELWATGIPLDDETSSTYRVTDANPGPGNSSPEALRFIDDRLWLSLSDGTTGAEPWVSDGSQDGTRPVADLDPLATESSDPYALGTLGPLLFFTIGSDRERPLWRSDGSASGTYFLEGPAGSPGRIDLIDPPISHGDFLYFAAAGANLGGAPIEELWRSDGETAEPVTSLGASEIGPIAGLGRQVLFTASVSGEFGLYSALSGAVIRLTSLGPSVTHGPSATIFRTALVSGTTRAFVLAHRTRSGDALWVSDGTPAGTRWIATLRGDTTFFQARAPGDRLFFLSSTPETGLELWTSDGTTAGTRLAADVLPGEPSSDPHDFAPLDGWLYFVADAPGGEPDDLANVWRIDADATTFERVHDDCVLTLVAASASLYFVPCSQRTALWVLEGEPLVTREVAVPEPGLFPFPLPQLGPLTPRGGLVYFTVEGAESLENLGRIWVSDGTAEGTRPFADVPFSSTYVDPPYRLEQAGGLLFFGADDGIHGRELWAVPLQCFATSHTLCLGDDRFQARARWRDFAGKAGVAATVPVSNESGGFWFFDESNPELFLKSLDGRSINDQYWVFFGSLSNVAFDVQVLDTLTGAERLYHNPSGRFASFGDTDAFDGESGGSTAIVPPAARPPVIETDSDATAPCVARPETQCQLGRFRVEVQWHDFAGQSGPGKVRGLSGDLQGFWFFDRDNVELVVKVLDGRPINGRYWVFFGSLTNVAFELTVTDTKNGMRRNYRNPLSNFASFGDTDAFVP